MRVGTILLVTAVVSAIRPLNASADGGLFLRDNWQMQSSTQVKETGERLSAPEYGPERWYPVSVPTTVLAGLAANKVYPDPYYGENLKKIPGYRAGPWLVMLKDSPFRPNWWYRTAFEVPADYAGKSVSLCFEGINYRANIWLNGRKIAGEDTVIGMFRRFEFDVADTLRIGKSNGLAVEIISPGKLPDVLYRTKQLEATTGWDDHNPQPPDLNMGIWQDVHLCATGPLDIRYPYVGSKLDVPSLETARLTLSVEVGNKTGEKVKGVIAGQIETINVSQEVELAPGETKTITFAPEAFAQLVISKPRVWWPNLVGKQELYELKLTATVNGQVSDTESTQFGIREATTFIDEEGWRAYKINGRRILIRGGAWMTSDMLLRLTPSRYDALIRYAKEANFNMLRSEGFSIRETEDFYNTCDKYGIMVTQQIFGRNIPDENLAIACIKDMMLRIRNHPSLVHFLGHDETFPTPSLDKAYRDMIAQYTPERTYQPHSGAFDVKDRFKTGGTRTGTRELWTYANPAQYYRGKEDGAWGFAQSGGIGGIVAPIESMRRMMPKEALWPPWTDAWSFHTVIQGGTYFDAMVDALNARYGKATGIEDFCTKAMAMNYESARGMFEAYGRNKYSATGITTWKYDAAWPASPTWQYVDWYLLVGGAYYGAKKACEPLHVQYSYDDHSIYVVNGLYEDHKGLRVSARVLNLDMAEKFAKTATVDVAADGKAKAFVIEWPKDLTKTYFLSLTLDDAAGKRVTDNLYWLSTVPDIPGTQGHSRGAFRIVPKSTADFTDLSKLPAVKLNVSHKIEQKGDETVAHVTVENPDKSLAFMVHLAVTKGEAGPEVTPTYWQDNYFSLLPGEKKDIRGIFATQDLESASPTLTVDGWNVKR